MYFQTEFNKLIIMSNSTAIFIDTQNLLHRLIVGW
jgi:hypothetical protein